MIPPIANRFVAGEDSQAAIEYATDLEDRGVTPILNLLGEHYDDPEEAAADAAEYRDLVDAVAAADTDACVSVKPTQVGLDVSESVFHDHVDDIVAHAAERDVFVWIDMEDHTMTDATLDAFERQATEHDGGVGICVQSNLRRNRDDLARLADLPGKVRLVKGAYTPPRDVAYQTKAEINDAYREDLEFAFREFDDGVGVGSHDPAMIEYAVDLHETYGTDFEIQMLMGVRDDAQADLARDHPVYQYVPYGPKWLSYFYRRVRERKENALFALRALVG